MRVYICCSSREKDRANAMAAKLEALGHEISSSWHREDYEPGTDNRLTRDEQIRVSNQCVGEIEDAEVFWMLYPRTASIGAFVELGYALHEQEHLDVIVTGVGSSNTVFTAIAGYRDESDDLGLVEVQRLAGIYERMQAIGSVP